MKRVTKIIASLIFAGSFVSNIFALDFGGLFKNVSKIDTQSFESLALNQRDSIVGWFKAPITNDGRLYFSIETDATFRYSVPALEKGFAGGSPNFMMDLSLLKITYFNNVWNGLLQLNGGRFLVSDSTGLICAQNADGVQATFNSNIFRAILYAGYTGLTNSRYGTILDGSDSTFKTNSSSVYHFNSPYLIAEGSFELPYLFANQTIGVEAFGFIGMPGINGDNSGYNRLYITALLNGPIISGLYYSASTTFEVLNGVSNLSTLSLTCYPTALSSSVSANLVYASGENGALKPFKGFSSINSSYSYDDPEYSGILKTGISGTIRPTDIVFISAGVDAVFSCPKEFDYSGFQWKAQAQFQIYTDFKVGFSAYQFYGKNSSQNNTGFALNVDFAF